MATFPPTHDRPPSPDAPRALPHPFLPTLYVNSYPPDLPDSVIQECLGRCPVKINLPPAVPPAHRLMPDAYYEWMTRSGTLSFETAAEAEKALAMLHLHPSLVNRGVWVSPLPPSHPLPPSPIPAERIFIPHKLVHKSDGDTIPSLADIYDALRPWGSLKSVAIWITDAPPSPLGDPASWFAKAEFWYRHEAEVFERDFGRKGWQIKGWQIHIFTPGQPFQDPNMLHTPSSEHPSTFPLTHQSYIPAPLPPPSMSNLPNAPSVTPVQFPPALPAHFFPPTPPSGGAHPADPIPPWASHNPYAYRPSPPITPNSKSAMTRSVSGSGSPPTRQGAQGAGSRRWSLTVGETADGSVQPTGLISDDGTVIQHGPGQHIRPAPAFGPGSQSISGLVDYSNVFIKNLDADVNSYYLRQVFSEFGVVVSAKVMRDEAQRSRGYGFVSFEAPEQASRAISAMNEKPFGRQTLSVTLHEPRKLRPDKIAERAAMMGLAVRSSNPTTPSGLSPTQGQGRAAVQARDRDSSISSPLIPPLSPLPNYPEPTDDIRLLSPAERQTALHRRLSARVRQYAKKHRLGENEDSVVEGVVGRLMPMDLALVPLLYNRWEMDGKIREVLEGLRAEARVGKEEEEGHPTKKDVQKLKEQLAKIDPDNAEEVVKIILDKGMVSREEWEKGWVERRAGVAIMYGEAKRFLVRVGVLELEAGNEKEKGEAKEEEEEGKPDLIPVQNLSMDTLALLPVSQILSHLASPAHLTHLALTPPPPNHESTLTAWYAKMTERGKFAARGELVGLLSRQCVYGQVPGLMGSKSQKLKVLGDFANVEGDDEGLVRLTLYPAVLEAKLGAFIKARSANASLA
ncbi:hypothetical protein IAR50_001160 [Cryptococcus sp. DSM 104548]